MSLGILLVAAWAVIGILSPIFGYLIDKYKGTTDKDAKFSTGYSDMRVSTMKILIYTLPLLIAGIILNYFNL